LVQSKREKLVHAKLSSNELKRDFVFNSKLLNSFDRTVKFDLNKHGKFFAKKIPEQKEKVSALTQEIKRRKLGIKPQLKDIKENKVTMNRKQFDSLKKDGKITGTLSNFKRTDR